MRRLPMTRICSIVCGCWAWAAMAEPAKVSNNAARAARLMVLKTRRMEVCLIFTGQEPCGEHKYWCDPRLGFTGRICTPSLLENLFCLKERLIILDCGHSAQTAGSSIGTETTSFSSFPRRVGTCGHGLNPNATPATKTSRRGPWLATPANRTQYSLPDAAGLGPPALLCDTGFIQLGHCLEPLEPVS